jgi:hypothetical protein
MNKMAPIIIAQCKENHDELLSANWDRVESFRNDDKNGKLAINVTHHLSFRGDEQELQTDIGFGKRFKDSRKSILDNPAQTTLPFTSADPSDPTDKPIESIKKKKKSAKNVVDSGIAA